MRFISTLLLIAGVASQEGRAQPALRPLAVMEVGPYLLGHPLQTFVTNEARVLVCQSLGTEEEPPRIAIWDGFSGVLIRSTLAELAPETRLGYGCGGGGGFFQNFTIHPNWEVPAWDALNRRMQWPAPGAMHLQAMDEGGNLTILPLETRPSVTLSEQGIDNLRLTYPSGAIWDFSMPSILPDGFRQTPIHRAIVGKLGFRDVLADPEGRWVASIWEGAVESTAPNRRVVPYHRDKNPRWLLWRTGIAAPVMNVPLASILGPSNRLRKLALSAAGDRVVINTESRVVIFDPVTTNVLASQPGYLIKEIPGRNQLLVRTPVDSVYLRLDLATGAQVSTFTLPDSLDPVEDQEISDRRRPLGTPIAFSPEGRYMVTPRCGRQGAHWDGLVIWDLDQR